VSVQNAISQRIDAPVQHGHRREPHTDMPPETSITAPLT
jgi:hypothetical protein